MVLVIPAGHALAKRRRMLYEESLDFPQIGLRDSSIVRETLATTLDIDLETVSPRPKQGASRG